MAVTINVIISILLIQQIHHVTSANQITFGIPGRITHNCWLNSALQLLLHSKDIIPYFRDEQTEHGFSYMIQALNQRTEPQLFKFSVILSKMLETYRFTEISKQRDYRDSAELLMSMARCIGRLTAERGHHYRDSRGAKSAMIAFDHIKILCKMISDSIGAQENFMQHFPYDIFPIQRHIYYADWLKWVRQILEHNQSTKTLIIEYNQERTRTPKSETYPIIFYLEQWLATIGSNYQVTGFTLDSIWIETNGRNDNDNEKDGDGDAEVEQHWRGHMRAVYKTDHNYWKICTTQTSANQEFSNLGKIVQKNWEMLHLLENPNKRDYVGVVVLTHNSKL